MHHALISPIVLGNLGHQQGSTVDPLLVRVTPEPSLSEEDHLFPVIPDRVADQDCDRVDHGNVRPKNIAVQVLDGEKTEVVSRIGRDLFQVVHDVDGSIEALG